jgi:hypothetical protein
MRVRLIRKLAEALDGVDLSAYAVGDVLDVGRYTAELLIAEQWVEEVPETSTPVPSKRKIPSRHRLSTAVVGLAHAADNPKRTLRTAERLREVRQQLERKSLGEQERRRSEDAIREELRDSRAKTLPKPPSD